MGYWLSVTSRNWFVYLYSLTYVWSHFARSPLNQPQLIMSSNTIRSWPSHESSSRAVEDRSSTAGRSSATTRSPGIVQESESQENECTICYEVTTSSEYCTVQPCGHVFDYTCIMRWLESQWRSTGQIIRLTCPLCRRLIHHLRHQYDEERSTYRTLDLRHHFRNERPEERSQLDVFTRNDDIQREYINETRRRMSTPALAIDGRNRGNGMLEALIPVVCPNKKKAYRQQLNLTSLHWKQMLRRLEELRNGI